jgi:uncharacterized protein YutE (UPF0331/DUF86 family)
MDALQFLAAVINSLAWPLTTVALVFVLREPVNRVLTALTRLKYKDLELDFGRELKKIEEKAKAIEVLPAPTAKVVGGPKEPYELLEEAERLAPEFPEPAVAVAWSAIEDSLWKAVERLTSTTTFRGKPASKTIQELLQREAIDRETIDVLNRMRNLRNEAVHGRWNAFGGVSADEAREFIALARGIHERLGNIAR